MQDKKVVKNDSNWATGTVPMPVPGKGSSGWRMSGEKRKAHSSLGFNACDLLIVYQNVPLIHIYTNLCNHAGKKEMEI